MADIDVTMTVTQDDKTLTVETKYTGGDREIPARRSPTSSMGARRRPISPA
jgi:hypothetical protein